MARLRPSGSNIWVNCPGAVQLQERFPEPTDSENEAAREGTAAHFVLECMLNNIIPVPVETFGPNGVVITDEMIDGAELAINDVIYVAGLDSVQSEKHVKIQRVHPTECEGTPDITHYNKELTVWDYKYGHGIVEISENWQLICYAIGKLDEITGGDGIKDQHIRVNLRVIQPRVYHPDGPCRVWSIMGSELRAYANILQMAADEALSSKPKCKSGSWCKHCTARADCQTADRAAMNAIDLEQSLTAETIPDEYLATHRASLKRAKEAIEHRLTGIEAQIIATVKAKRLVKGLTTDNPPGKPKWSKPDSEIITLGDLMGVKLSTPKLKTPIQCEKLLDESVIKAYTFNPTGKTVIVDSDKSRAHRVFG